MASTPCAPVSPFGARLRQWRHHRRLSQLALAAATSTTARHISFLETGRSRPSRHMVLRLAKALDVGLRDTNELLHAAAQSIVNWPEVAWAGLDRLRENARHAPFDPVLPSLISRAEAALAGIPRPQPAEAGLIVCPWFRMGNTIVRTIAMTAAFDHAADVTLDELRAELIYPLDDAADHFFRAH